jgi:hypothetical protein
MGVIKINGVGKNHWNFYIMNYGKLFVGSLPFRLWFWINPPQLHREGVAIVGFVNPVPLMQRKLIF